MNNHYDIIIIGAGSGGIASARAASNLNAKVLLIEKSTIGGTCVNKGCVPKKLCYNLTSILETLKHIKPYGITGNFQLDFKQFVLRRENYIHKLNLIYKKLISTPNITYIEGEAEILDSKVKVNDNIYTYDNVLLATGAKPTMLNLKNNHLLKTSDDFFNLTEVPKKSLIIGSGYISVELSFILRELGSEVIVIARGNKVLSHFDHLIGDSVKLFMERKGIRIIFDCEVVEIKEDGVKIRKKKKIIQENIFCGRLLMNHLYSIKRENNLKQLYRIEDFVPSVIFSHPPSASVGLSELEARRKSDKIEIKTSKFKNLYYGMMDDDDKEESYFKIILIDNKVVGVHLVGMGVDEIIQGFAVAVKMGCSYEDFQLIVLVHPTAAEEVVTMK